jgi:hydroxylamine reductase (hybrid-cluster protein)
MLLIKQASHTNVHIYLPKTVDRLKIANINKYKSNRYGKWVQCDNRMAHPQAADVENLHIWRVPENIIITTMGCSEERIFQYRAWEWNQYLVTIITSTLQNVTQTDFTAFA